MTLTITLTADRATGAGVDFNAGYADFFKNFTPSGFPLFNGPTSARTTQIVHLDTPVRGQEANARAVLLDGDDFVYTWSNHSVSGTIREVSLTRLGDAYDPATGQLVTRGGVVTDATDFITISGMNVTNRPGVKGDVHNIVAGLMGGGPNGVLADAAPLTAKVFGEAHSVFGSKGADRYVGTAWADTVRGGDGDDYLSGGNGNDNISGGSGRDTLLGGNGADTLNGGAGADILRGGAGADRLTGGTGADVFLFNTIAETTGDRILDFSRSAGDRIRLDVIDANETVSGNQAFKFIGTAGFSGAAGELRYAVGATATTIAADTDGDRVADMRIVLEGQHTLIANSFFL